MKNQSAENRYFLNKTHPSSHTRWPLQSLLRHRQQCVPPHYLKIIGWADNRSVSGDKIQISLLLLRRGALSILALNSNYFLIFYFETSISHIPPGPFQSKINRNRTISGYVLICCCPLPLCDFSSYFPGSCFEISWSVVLTFSHLFSITRLFSLSQDFQDFRVCWRSFPFLY